MRPPSRIKSRSHPKNEEVGLGKGPDTGQKHRLSLPCNYEVHMATDSIVQVRIDRRIKKEAAHVLEGMGLSVSDAVRMLLMRIAREKAIPFDIRVPNAETVAAIDELESGKGVSSNSVEELMADLNAPD